MDSLIYQILFFISLQTQLQNVDEPDWKSYFLWSVSDRAIQLFFLWEGFEAWFRPIIKNPFY